MYLFFISLVYFSFFLFYYVGMKDAKLKEGPYPRSDDRAQQNGSADYLWSSPISETTKEYLFQPPYDPKKRIAKGAHAAIIDWWDL